MSHLFTRTLFASASVALTVAMVAASAPASATTQAIDFHRTTVQVSDLNLASTAGQKTLTRRLQVAATDVCPNATIVVDVRCRTAAIEHARADIAQRTPSSSARTAD